MEAYKKDKEFMELVGHLIQHPRFQKLGNIPQHHYSTRMEHSINVAYTSYKIAKKLVGMKIHGARRTFTRFLLLRLARNQV